MSQSHLDKQFLNRLRYDGERSLWILYFVTANCLSLTYSNLSQPSSSNKTLLLQPAGLVFDRAVAAFLSLDLHILENKLVSTLIPMQTWLESCNANCRLRLLKRVKIERKWSYPNADWPRPRRGTWGWSLFTKRGLFLNFYFLSAKTL